MIFLSGKEGHTAQFCPLPFFLSFEKIFSLRTFSKMTSRSARTGRSTGPNEQLFSARSHNDPMSEKYGQGTPSNASAGVLPNPATFGMANGPLPPSAGANNQQQQEAGLAVPGNVRDQYGVGGNEESDPLQLEHMVGYCGDYHKTVLFLPSNEQVFIRSLGALVTIENINDPHAQQFLRGHDMPVSSPPSLPIPLTSSILSGVLFSSFAHWEIYCLWSIRYNEL